MTTMKPLTQLRVLVVEDDYYLASDEQAVLEAAGATVVGPTGSVEEACSLATHGEIDCAMVDINLGHGPTFAIALALQRRGIPFVFTTGYDAAAIPAEFDDVVRLEKPVNEKRLLEAVRGLA